MNKKTGAGRATSVRVVTVDDLDRPDWTPDLVLTYKTVDGLNLPMQIFYPSGHKPGERRTVVLCIHGGGWGGRRNNDPWDGSFMVYHARYFASRGAVGVVISYRNVANPALDPAGFTKGPSVFDLLCDCRSAVRTIRTHAFEFGIDPDRLVAMGDSAGGHLAACLGTIDRYDHPGDEMAISAMANAVISCSGILDMTRKPCWFDYIPVTPLAGETGRRLSRVARAKLISPVFNISRRSAPSLIMHGLSDAIVPTEPARVYQQRMRRAGVRCELKLYRKGLHAFILPGYTAPLNLVVRSLRAADSFLVKLGFLTGRPTFEGASAPTKGLKRVCRMSAVQEMTGEGGVPAHFCPGMGAATVSLRFKPVTLKGVVIQRVAALGYPIFGYALSLDPVKGLVLKVEGKDRVAKGNVGRPVLGQWNHVAFSIGNGRILMNLNGRTMIDVASSVRLAGNRLSLGAFFSGRLKDVHVYAGTPTADRLSRL